MEAGDGHGTTRTIEELELVGGSLALDFVNTLNGRAEAAPVELLKRYDDLLTWCVRTELFGKTEAARLRALAAERPDDAEAALERARALREALFGIFAALAAESEPLAWQVELLNEVLSEGMARRRLRRAPSGYCWAWAEAPDGLGWMRWPIAYDAAELLTSSRLDRVKECGQDDCRWLFLDLSRNRSRRWCTMEECGNRAKAKRHYHRQRAAEG